MPGAKRLIRPVLWSDLTIREQQNTNLSKRDRGRAAESAVAAFLALKGYTLLTANYSVAHLGELDLVMFHAPTLAVIEVKARQDSLRFGGPAAALTPAKMRRIRLTTLHFQQKNHFMNNPVELLAALVQLDRQGNAQHIEIIPIEWQ